MVAHDAGPAAPPVPAPPAEMRQVHAGRGKELEHGGALGCQKPECVAVHEEVLLPSADELDAGREGVHAVARGALQRRSRSEHAG